jgi:pimeloyl-ACP methyl ester carboxylesterase
MPRVLLAVAIAGVLLAGACGKDDDEMSGGNGRSVPLPGGAEGFTPAAVDWQDCPASTDLDCAKVQVPLDYTDLGGPKIDIAVLRVPATGDRIGSLLVNPGGPGASGTDFVAEAYRQMPEAIHERFDIIGFDPRGVPDSTALTCGFPIVDLYAADPTIEDEADADALVDISRRYAEDCETKAGDLLPHLGTRDVARDLDVIRGALGEETISYIGFSYGTSIGQAYADLFPTRIRAMVLDGVVPLGVSGIDLAVSQAVGFEGALDSFAAACNADSDCPLAPDAMKAVDRVLADAEQPGGIPAPSASRPLGPGDATTAMAAALYAEDTWPILETAIDTALDGDASQMILLADYYYGGAEFSVYYDVNCLDQSWPSDPQALLDAAKDAGKQSPHLGEAFVNDYIRCPVWPTPPQPLEAVTAPGAAPIVVISTTGDPATPYEGGVAVAEALESGVLVTNVGRSHTSFAEGKPCIDDLVVAYLIDLTAPEDGTRCE